MIELTREQRQELASETPTARDPETGETYVLVKADVYERLRRILDDDGLTSGQVAALIAEAMREDDAGDPLLDSYQDYRR